MLNQLWIPWINLTWSWCIIPFIILYILKELDTLEITQNY